MAVAQLPLPNKPIRGSCDMGANVAPRYLCAP